MVSSVAPDKKHSHWWQVLSGISILAGVSLGLLYLNHIQKIKHVESMNLDLGRDYKRMPFDMIDATFYCQLQTELKFGEDLALSYIDEHSTRVDQRTGVIKIFMIAYVGELDNYEENSVHCFVDPERRMLTHYRTINIENATLMARALRFFGAD